MFEYMWNLSQNRGNVRLMFRCRFLCYFTCWIHWQHLKCAGAMFSYSVLVFSKYMYMYNDNARMKYVTGHEVRNTEMKHLSVAFNPHASSTFPILTLCLKTTDWLLNQFVKINSRIQVTKWGLYEAMTISTKHKNDLVCGFPVSNNVTYMSVSYTHLTLPTILLV